MRTVLESGEAFGAVSIQPLVKRGPADAVPSAQLGKGEEGTLGLQDEAGSLSYHRCSSPRHRSL
ncbi:MAG: hypothetical protein M3418_12035, partial [Gemmatimonadota bacterium]|nr:hypothetical protein [Gemmatimonadota bacterium]